MQTAANGADSYDGGASSGLEALRDAVIVFFVLDAILFVVRGACAGDPDSFKKAKLAEAILVDFPFMVMTIHFEKEYGDCQGDVEKAAYWLSFTICLISSAVAIAMQCD